MDSKGCCTRRKILLNKPPRDLDKNSYDSLLIRQTKNFTQMDWYKNGIKVESWNNFNDIEIPIEMTDYDKITMYNNKKEVIFDGDMNSITLDD